MEDAHAARARRLMRIIAGSARGLRLRAPSGKATRPTSDRARETLFNVIASWLPDATVLDLFAGTGALGLEALSRGARTATFVENDRSALSALRHNIERARLADRASVLPSDWRRALRALADDGSSFDVVLIDPPWAAALGERCLEALASGGLTDASTRAVLEHRESDPVAVPAPWEENRRLRVGETGFVLCSRGVPDADPC